MRAWRRSQCVIAAIALSATEAVPASSGPISLVPAAGQTQTAGPAAKASSDPQGPVATFKVSARMVAVQVVAQDHQGHPIPGLTASDFQVFEQVAPKGEQYSQKIAAVRAVNVTELAAAQSKHEVQIPSGIYTNLVSTRTVAVPPTVLLVDGINTDLTFQMQVRRQMARMLDSIPEDTPVAVFLLGQRLEMIEDFTTDHKLLKSAVQEATMVRLDSVTPKDPANNLELMSPTLGASSGLAQLIEQFEQETEGYYVQERVKRTVDALRALTFYVAGYPGRKNLIWISSSFPIAFNTEPGEGTAGMRDFLPEIKELTNALADAKVAVYPMDPAGVAGYSFFSAANRSNGSAAAMSASTNREDRERSMRQATMQRLADQTGGKVCINDNDLGDCVKKAEDDGRSFYEIAYYPHEGDWQGEFHSILIKTSRPGAHLAYRRGYYAQAEGAAGDKSQDTKGNKAGLEWAACIDPLTAGSILLVAKQVTANQPGTAKYSVAIEPDTISFVPTNGGMRELALHVAVCSFDKSGKALQFVVNTIDRKLTDQEFAAVQAQHGFSHFFEVASVAGAATVRLLVKDVVTGQLGSVNVPVAETPSKALP